MKIPTVIFPAILMMLVLLLLTPLTAKANEFIPTPDGNDHLWQIIMGLESERDDLRRQLDALREQIEAAGEGNIRLVSPHNITVEAGEEYEITITVRNVGSHPAFGLFTVAAPAEGSPFTVEFLRNSNSVSQVGANAQRNMTLRITVHRDADPGNHSIELNHFFRDNIGRTETSQDRINVRIGGDVGTPTLEIRDMNAPTTAVDVGSTGTISFYLHNTGDVDARNISVRATTPDGIVPATQSTVSVADIEEGESRLVSFGFRPTSSAGSRAYDIQFTVSYGTGDDAESFSQFAALIVNNPDDDDGITSILEIRQITAPEETLNVGQTGTVRFYVYNAGEADVRNINVTAAVPTADADALVPVTQSRVPISVLAPGESAALSFGFRATQAASTRAYDVQFTVSYGTGDAAGSFSQFASFNVYNPDEEDEDERNIIPRVMVSSYYLDPPVPHAGQEFTMTITFRNTNSLRSVNNIRILMEEILAANAPGQGQGQQHFAGFAPIAGSNTLFIDNLNPLEEVTHVLRFTTSGEATSGVHTMRIAFDYQDQDFENHSAEQQISISVAQVARLELRNIDITPFAQVDVPVRFSLGIINSGRVNLSSIRIRTEGPFDVAHAGGDEGEFIGQINFQRATDFHGQFVPQLPGEQEGVFVVFGEDPTGAIVEVRHYFTVFVEEGWTMDDEFAGGGFPGDMPGRPGFNGGGMFFEDEEDETGALTRFFRAVFTREVIAPPEWWDPEFDGEFTAETAEMFGIEPETRTRWLAAIGIPAIIILAIAVPVVLVVRKKSKLDFDDEG